MRFVILAALCAAAACMPCAHNVAAMVPRPATPEGIVRPIAEGFFTDKVPPAVRAIWPSVYAFVCEGGGGVYTATAFLVGKANQGKLATYYFVTAGHAVEDCRSPRRYLAENINQSRFEDDGITIARPPPRLDAVKTVYVDDAYDVAVVKIEASPSLRIGAPLQVGDQCNRSLHRAVFAVGFPGVGKRRSLRMSREVKRWSRGEYVGIGTAEFRGTQSRYIASTVDSLPGNSGGPVVDEHADLVGVVVKGAANEENGYRYDVDPQKQNDWHSFLVPCDALSKIIRRSGIARRD
jgi:S1-C subfamily serine protease